MGTTARAAMLLVLVAVLLVWALSGCRPTYEPVSFKSAVTPPSGSARKGVIEVTLTPDNGVTVSAETNPYTAKISAPEGIVLSSPNLARLEPVKKPGPQEFKGYAAFSAPYTVRFSYKDFRKQKGPAEVTISFRYDYIGREDNLFRGTCDVLVTIP